MFFSARQTEIIELAKSEGRVLVEDLAARFSVTPQTIRKDLNELCENRTLNRIHGGAIFRTAPKICATRRDVRLQRARSRP